MKAIWNGQIIAESNQTLKIEGNEYFPAESINHAFFESSDLHTNCPWKGEASYYKIKVNGEVNEDAAWYYPTPREGSINRVAQWNNGKGDFSNYVAFWRGVEVVE